MVPPYVHIATEINNNILACHLVTTFLDRKSIVKVWSMNTHELMFEQEVFELQRMLHDDTSNILVLIQCDKVEVLSFDESSVSVSRCVNEEPLFDEVIISRIAFPYLLFSHIDALHSMFMWQWDENSKEINQFKYFRRVCDWC